MQENVTYSTSGRWKKALAALFAVLFACALGGLATQTAWADVTVQKVDATGKVTPDVTISSEQLEKLATEATDPIARGSVYTTNYVSLDRLFAEAGLAQGLDAEDVITFVATDGIYKKWSCQYGSINSGVVNEKVIPAVLAIKYASSAEDTQKADDSCPRLVVGVNEEKGLPNAGRSMVSGVTHIIVVDKELAATASSVNDSIIALPDTITSYADADKVHAAKSAYDALKNEQVQTVLVPKADSAFDALVNASGAVDLLSIAYESVAGEKATFAFNYDDLNGLAANNGDNSITWTAGRTYTSSKYATLEDLFAKANLSVGDNDIISYVATDGPYKKFKASWGNMKQGLYGDSVVPPALALAYAQAGNGESSAGTLRLITGINSDYGMTNGGFRSPSSIVGIEVAQVSDEEANEAKAASELIAGLPVDISVEDETAINEARDAYDSLSANAQALVLNAEVLTSAEKSLIDVKVADAEQRIAAAKADPTEENVKAAQDAVAALSETAAAKISDKSKGDLEGANAAMLVAKAKADPTEENIAAAKAAIDSLSDAAKDSLGEEAIASLGSDLAAAEEAAKGNTGEDTPGSGDDGKTDTVAPAAQTITTSVKDTVSKTFGAKAFSLGAKANTALSYTSDKAKVATVDKDGKVTIKGAGTAKITITAAATASYEKATKTITVKVAKAKNTLAVKAKSPALKAKSLKKKAQTIAMKKAFTVTKGKAKSTVTFKKASGNKKITVAKNGKITVKKGLKKGTYKVKVKVTAAANANYKAATKTVTVKVKVK